MRTARHAGLLAIAALAAACATAPAPPAASSIDGRRIEYVYPDGGRVQATFEDGTFSYRWLAGASAGNVRTDLAYVERTLAPNVYFISWHDPANRNFGAIVYDFTANTVQASAIRAYGTPDEAPIFDNGEIVSVEMLD